MIDEKKLIEEIQDHIEKQRAKCDQMMDLGLGDLVAKYNHGKYCYVNALHLVQSQPKVGEWIPCSERLPEDEETKLVTLSDGKVEGAFWNERNWWCMGDSINLETRTEDVIAWQPLPTPYNAKRGGKNE